LTDYIIKINICIICNLLYLDASFDGTVDVGPAADRLILNNVFKREARVKKQKAKKGRKNDVLKRKQTKRQRKDKAKKEKKNKRRTKRKNKSKRGRKEKQKNRNRKSRNKKRNRKGRRGQRSTVSIKCLSQAVSIMKVWKDVVSNFKKQNARMKSQKSTGGKKSDKKGLFAPTAFKLIDIGGGNRSNLSCGGVYGSDGAKQLGNLTKTLLDCELSVNASCNPANFPQPNTTFIEACEKSTATFEIQAQKCVNSSMSDVSAYCDCWTASSLNTSVEAVKPCKANTFTKKIKVQLEKCKTAFSTCRKYEDSAVESLSACSKTTEQHSQKVIDYLKYFLTMND